jgi:hypothetical protein
MSATYLDFLARKRPGPLAHGFDPPAINERLYEFQRDVTVWALRAGRAAIFADCGLGKTPMQLEWAHRVVEHTGGDVLILAPLAVSGQTMREAERFGIEARVVREPEDLRPGISITNYERYERFARHPWRGLVLDESSILKSFDGKTRAGLTEWGQTIPYRLCATATPSPNDYEELGGHSEFLGVLTRRQMLAEFFVNDGISAGHWRLKGHGQDAYWRWITTWARAFRDPSDLGYPSDGFALPPLNVHVHEVDGDHVAEDRLFAVPASTLSERRQARRESLSQRVRHALDLVGGDEPCVVWCDLNSESEALARTIPDAVEVRGSDPPDVKEDRLLAFTDGQARVLVTKPRIGGWGLNWQHCARMVFVGLSDSYESYYQAVRRCWRFGQCRPVEVHIVASRLEQAVLENIRRKEAQAADLFERVVRAMERAA